jgi:hypothetical protein
MIGDRSPLVCPGNTGQAPENAPFLTCADARPIDPGLQGCVEPGDSAVKSAHNLWMPGNIGAPEP